MQISVSYLNYDCYKRPDVVFSVETFIDLFA